MQRFLFLFLFWGAALWAKPLVLVSVAPALFLVQTIGGETIEAQGFVPSAVSPHSFEPTIRQLLAWQKAVLWIQIGEPFEKKTSNVLLSYNPNMRLFDLTEGLPLLVSRCSCHKDHDTHIWLSPRLIVLQAELIRQALTALQPQYGELYQSRADALAATAQKLDQEFQTLFRNNPTTAILVCHPAFAYFCRDYGMRQLSVEQEGRDPCPQQLATLIEEAKRVGITRVFTQKQYQNKGSCLIAKELNAEVVEIDPYSPDLFNNLHRIAHLFAGGKL